MKVFIFTIALVLISVITLTSCAPKDDFADYSVTEHPPVEKYRQKPSLTNMTGTPK